MMEDDAWTKAVFVRDPKMRVLSAYLDKGLPFDGGWVGGKCCKNEGQCRVRASETFAGFVQVAEDCPNPRWDVQSLRMEGKYWVSSQLRYSRCFCKSVLVFYIVLIPSFQLSCRTHTYIHIYDSLCSPT